MQLARTPVRVRSLAFLLAVAAFLVPSFLVPAAHAAATLDTEEAAFCRQINSYRASSGLPALLVSLTLNNDSDWHTADMATKDYFSHTDSLGRDPFMRMTAFGYNFNTYKGENIAAGNAAANATFEQWKASSEHNANMLGTNYKVIGIGRNYQASSTYQWYWNTTFGETVDAGAVPCPN
jgi:uncharacterized protein YkwD